MVKMVFDARDRGWAAKRAPTAPTVAPPKYEPLLRFGDALPTFYRTVKSALLFRLADL